MEQCRRWYQGKSNNHKLLSFFVRMKNWYVLNSSISRQNINNQFQAGPESFNKGECKRLTWTEGKINKPKKNQGSNFDNLFHATTDIRSREKQRKSRNDQKGNSSVSAFLSIQWCMGICMSVIIVVALLVVQSNSRYMISRGLLSRRRRQF